MEVSQACSGSEMEWTGLMRVNQAILDTSKDLDIGYVLRTLESEVTLHC